MQSQHDVVVIGGSFAGLSAAMQLARARRRVLVIDGRRPRNRFAARSHGFFGQDGRAPEDIVGEATAQLAAYPDVTFRIGEARTAERGARGFVVTTDDGGEIGAERLILATGVRDELPALAGLEARWGTSVLHCPYCHGYEIGAGRIGVLATHPMSLHQAQLVADWGPLVWFTQGIVEPGAEEAAQLAARGVRIEAAPVVEVLGEAPRLAGLRLADGRVVEVDALFVGTRTLPASDLATQLGCAFDEAPLGPVVRVDAWNQTSVPGVFAAGDMANPMTNATFASASGVLAGVGAHRSLIFPAGQ
ncbi:NAD(P)/FAD-dependent oxidoreductase [Burkholderia perseverans]|uniref:NAD(P)/FAD-dependent oxidoreductase n=1 Tax=Burkholderia perseverans TaxID=2615214 RepID=UPI001FEDD7B1|nr:NAD(P)/FAD-dependent oxidoreductase [Burkholderia perseverans]